MFFRVVLLSKRHNRSVPQQGNPDKPFRLVQGFSLLKNRTLASEDQLESLLQLGIEVASLSSDIANPKPIHQAEHRTVERGQQARDSSRTSLTGIFISRDRNVRYGLE